jgi:hypothetical protein
MKICVFDTETTSLEKPFCYNVGFIIYDTETAETLAREEYVTEQIWHNMELFSSAYYAEKRPFYVNSMRARKIFLEKWGYITQRMRRLFKLYNVECAFAYNSNFDEKVFDFNCDWFKTQNPFDSVPILDIRGYFHHFIAFTPEYKNFCDENSLYTESGHYSTTAEAGFRFISQDKEFIEAHTALADADIELQILLNTASKGAVIGNVYNAYRSIKREQEKVLTIRDKTGEEHKFDYKEIRINKDKTEIKLK